MGYGKLYQRDVARIRNYQEAKQYYDNTKPIRGRDKPAAGVPLRKDRRDSSASLRELTNGDMALRLYSTDIIIWHKDNETITVDVSYNSQTTVKWAHAYLDHALRVSQHYGYTLLNNFYVCVKPMTFKIEGAKLTLLSKPTQMMVERLDRAKARKVREQSEEFYKYLRTMCAFEVTAEIWNSLKKSTEPLAQDLYKCAVFYISEHHPYLEYYDFEATKHKYTEAKYREADAYYMDDLPLGALHKNMVVKS